MVHWKIAGANVGEWKLDRTLSSMSSIMRFTTTTDTGNPIAVPSAWQYTFQLKDRKFASKHRGSRPMMSSTVKPVHSERKESLSSLWQVTRMARSVGTDENSETTLNDTKVSTFATICDFMNSTNALEFLTWELVRPTNWCQ